MRIYDISQEVFGCSVYPGDPTPKREVLSELAKGDVCNLTAFSMCAHNGTHVDAPYHFIADGETVEKIPLSAFVGEAFVASCTGDVTAKDARDILTSARAVSSETAKRILIAGCATVTEEAAALFRDAGVLLLGNESQTVGPEDAPAAVHRILLSAGVVLLEGVRLSHVPSGAYLLCAAPLALAGADGAPCRALLIAREEKEKL